MKTKLLLLFIVNTIICSAQAPFSTPVMEPISLEVKKNDNEKKYFVLANEDTPDSEKIETSKKPSFFKNNSLSLSILNKGENRASISSQVLHYKLYIANPSNESFEREAQQSQEVYEKRVRKYRFNIPLFLISKLSSTYDSINSSSSIDLLDYEAAPITVRIMPSFNIPLKGVTDKLLFGFYADMRALNIFNSTSSEYDLEIVGSGGIGFTYEADGEAGVYDPEGDYSKGRYSISAIFQGATGKKDIIQNLYNTDKDYVTSFQSYFIFNSVVNSNLNLKIGYQYYFKETIGGSKSTLSIALGN